MTQPWRPAAAVWCGCGPAASSRTRMRERVRLGWRLPGGAPLLTLRLARRELRGGARGFLVFLACIALGVGAIAGIGSSADSLAEGLAREGQVILGGDVAFSLIH